MNPLLAAGNVDALYVWANDTENAWTHCRRFVEARLFHLAHDTIVDEGLDEAGNRGG